jgi:hypothetical protein
MKRIVLWIAIAATLLCGGWFTSTAQAHGPNCAPRYYSGYGRYNNYRAPFGPYNPGYIGGWQPYQSYYYRQPRLGLYIGF